MIQTKWGGDDTGGLVSLYESSTQFGSYSLLGSNTWASPYDWSGTGPTTGLWYKATETGNGHAYAGESLFSLVLQLGA